MIGRRLAQVGVVSGVAVLPAAGLVDLPVLAPTLFMLAALIRIITTAPPTAGSTS